MDAWKRQALESEFEPASEQQHQRWKTHLPDWKILPGIFSFSVSCSMVVFCCCQLDAKLGSVVRITRGKAV